MTHVAEKAWDLPHLVGSLCEGEISFDKVRVLADVATPESEGALCERAKRCTLCASWPTSPAPKLRWSGASSGSRSGSGHDGRFLRFNDTYRTISAQLPAASYAQTKAAVDAQLRHIPSDGATPLDQRRCDAFLGIVGSDVPGPEGSPATVHDEASPYVVVAHVPLDALVHDPGEQSTLAGELEHAV